MVATRQVNHPLFFGGAPPSERTTSSNNDVSISTKWPLSGKLPFCTSALYSRKAAMRSYC